MKTNFAGGVAVSALMSATVCVAWTGLTATAAEAANQASDTAAGVEYAPKPTPEEEFVYLRDIVSLQALRLDQAEQTLKKQNALIEAQAAKIEQLEASLGDVRRMAASGAPVPAGVHVVQQGDSLSRIAQRYGTNIGALARRNNLKAPYRLSVGQRIAYGSATASARVAAAPAAPAPQPAKQASQSKPAASQKQKAVQTAARPTVESDPNRAAPRPQRVAQTQTQEKPQQQPARRQNPRDDKPSNEPEEVGVRPDEDYDRPYLPITADIGGILTPKGTMWVEPSIDYTVASDNRFFFQGIDVQSAVLIGAIEATDSDRRAHIQGLGLRYGVTSRFEVDGRVAYVNRDDRISGVSIRNSIADVEDIKGKGFGDAEIGLHYQLTNGRKFPYTIANVRVKAPTGEGPFDLDRNADGFETEVAVGSGFWTVEPSLTFSIPTSPAVIFANVGYQMNLSTSPDLFTASLAPRTIPDPDFVPDPNDPIQNVPELDQLVFTNTLLTEFDPGDALRTNIGVGLSLNEKLSINFAYDQSYFFETSTTSIVDERIVTFIDSDPQDDDPNDLDTVRSDVRNVVTVLQEQPSATIGTFLFGGSYAVSPNFRIGLTAGIGATDEAPDARVSLRAQYKLFD
ncbi:MAG: LysM peptidoglycan-binding domain-containing protein [Pseudomonadota bacterium]